MIELEVTGMTCDGCVKSVMRAVERVVSAANPRIELASGRLELALTAEQSAELLPRVLDAIEAAGFGAAVRSQ